MSAASLVNRPVRALANMSHAAQPTSTASGQTAGWLTPGRFVLGLSALVLLSFPGVVLGTRTFVVRDFGLFSYPVAFFQRECFWRGELPLWNPLSHCGVPFLAQWNTMCLYPPSLFYLLLPLTWALPVFCLLHLVWGGLGMFVLSRSWTQNSFAGAVAGIIFAFSGLSLNFLMWPSHIATFSWLPWMLWLGPRAWRQGGRALLWSVLAGALQMLAGAPETILITWFLLGLLVCGDCLTREAPAVRAMARFTLMASLVGLLCGAQLLPFLELVSHAQRDSGYQALAHQWPMPVWGWANLLVPLFGTAPTPEGVYWQEGQYWTSSYYAGMVTVLLGAVALWRVREWRVRLLAAAVLGALVLALGERGKVYTWLSQCVPGVGAIRYPVKFVILVLGVAPLLAAVGLASLRDWSVKKYRVELGLLVGLVLLAGLIVMVSWRWHPGSWHLVASNGAVRAGFLVLISLLGFYAVKAGLARRVVQHGLLVGLVLMAVWLDLVTQVPNQNPTASPMVYSPGWVRARQHWEASLAQGHARAMVSPEAEFSLKYHSLPDSDKSYLLHRLGLMADCNLLDGIPQAHGFFSLVPGESSDATTAPYALANRDLSPLLDFMGVALTSAPGNPFDWVSRPSAMEMVTAGQQPLVANDRAVFSAFSQTNTDLRKVVFLPAEARGQVGAQAQADARVGEVQASNAKVVFRTDAAGPSTVVIAQTYYPGWKAYVDGTPTKLWRANYAFQALEVPAGRHNVVLRYEDKAFRVGLVLSAAGLAACVALWLSSKAQLAPGRTGSAAACVTGQGEPA